jgi:hypothetical protein
VTAIIEANDLATINLTTLFGKLEEHQHELMALEKHEKTVKKKKHSEKYKMKPIAPKVSSSKYKSEEHDDSSSSDNKWGGEANIRPLVRKYHKYIKRNDVEYSDENFIKFRNQTNNQGKAKGSKKDKGKTSKSGRNGRRAYITCESESESSTLESSSENEQEVTTISYMAKHQHKFGS